MKESSTKSVNKRPSKPTSKLGASSKPKRSSATKPGPKPVQQKPKSTKVVKKKPPHMRYTEKQLGVPQLNGIIPAGVSKPPNAKKGKHFVDDRESMNAILAVVMAEKEGNIESKLMRSRQLEEVREAKRAEIERRAEGRKAGLEERKEGIKDSRKKSARHAREGGGQEERMERKPGSAKSKKRVGFG